MPIAASPGTCLHCNRPRRIEARGLCRSCNDTPGLKAIYPRKRRDPVAIPTACRACSRVPPYIHGRGLCSTCYRCDEVRACFPPLQSSEPEREIDREPTAEEVEATIAAQLLCLPDWWAEDEEAMRERAEAERIEWCLAKMLSRTPLIQR